MFKRSLGLRILAINITLIVLPVLAYFLFLFDWEYNANIEIDIQRLRNIGASRAAYLEEFISDQFTALDIVETLTNLKYPNRSNDVQTQFDQIRGNKIYSGIAFLTETPEHHFIMRYVSPSKFVNIDYSFREYIGNSLRKGRDSYMAYDDTAGDKEFMLTKAVYSQTDYKFLGILGIYIPADSIISTLTDNQYFPNHENLSLLTADKIIFSSTNTTLENMAITPISQQRLSELKANKQFGSHEVPKKTLSLKPFSNLKDVFEWTDNGITRIAVLTPVVPGNHFIMVDMNKQILIDRYTKATLLTIAIMFAITLFSCIITLAISSLLSRALKELIRVMDVVSAGNLGARFESRLFGFEINEAGRTLNMMLEQLIEQTDKANAEQVKTEVVSKELRIGREIQQSILPHDLPKIPKLEIGVFSKPASEVGGDFYDIYWLGQKLIITLTDTSAKGLHAGLYSLGLRSMLRGFATMESDLGLILSKASALFYQDVQGTSLLVKTLIASWDHKSMTLDYASAGPSFGFVHLPKGQSEPLAGSRSPMGTQSDSTFPNYSLHLEIGSIVVLYTGGIVGQQNTDGDLYGEKNLRAVVEQHSLLGAKEIAEAITADIAQFVGVIPQTEDMTVIVLKAVDL